VAKAATLRSAPAIEVAILAVGQGSPTLKKPFDSPMACAYCVMRPVGGLGHASSRARALALAHPAEARRVGLVGAAVTDPPALPEILQALVDAGREVGVSSLRADRLDDELVGCWARRLSHADHRRRRRLARCATVDRHTGSRSAARGPPVQRPRPWRCFKLYVLIGLPGKPRRHRRAGASGYGPGGARTQAVAHALAFRFKGATPARSSAPGKHRRLEDKWPSCAQLRRHARLAGDAPKWPGSSIDWRKGLNRGVGRGPSQPRWWKFRRVEASTRRVDSRRRVVATLLWRQRHAQHPRPETPIAPAA